MRGWLHGWVFLLPTSAWAADIPVPAGSDLAGAVASASDGDRLLLAAGDHDATGVVLDGRTLELVGEGAGLTRLIGGGARVVAVEGGDVGLASLTVDGQGARAGIAASSAVLRVTDVDVVGVGVAVGGPAIRSELATVIVVGGTFAPGAGAMFEGGIVAVDGGVFRASGSTFQGGQGFQGGAIYAEQAASTLSDCVFSDNLAALGQRRGGAIAVVGGSLEVVGGRFTANRTDGGNGAGGAIHASGPDTVVDLVDVVFEGNSSERGGAIACDGVARCAVRGGTLQGNQAVTGGAIWARLVPEVQLDGGVFCGNQASASGGAAALEGGATEVTTSWFLDNLADAGGALEVEGGLLAVSGSSFLDNGAASGPAVRSDGAVGLAGTAVLWSLGAGPALVAGSGSDVRYVLWFGNGADGEPLGTPSLQVDPGIDEAGRHQCDPALLVRADDSPLIDAGDPAVLDPDGSPSDIGAWPPAALAPPIDADGDGSPAGVDCDDADPDVAVPILTCPDADGDAHGDPTAEVTRCEPPGSSLPCDDCDDADPSVHPGAIDGSDGTDRDCSGTVATIRYGTGCSEARGCSGGAAWLMVLPFFARRRR